MPDTKLETCPFCGKSAEVYNNGAHLDLGASYSDLPGIGCSNCHFAITRKTVRDALIIWNHRANNIEKKLTSTNAGSPKLPQFMDCVRWVEMKRNGGLSDSENVILLEMHNFIERQLQA